MPGEGTYLVEEFLQAVASQLDRTQDALAFKAVNRPLTYAIKEFNLQLQVFVEMDPEGNVRLRGSAPNETGASTMTIGFTTITRPMIEENTISLAATRSPSLAEAGFAPAERQRLERLGVRNTSQLRRLGSSTGASVMSRLTEIPVMRLRAALQLQQPAVTGIHAAGPDGDGTAARPTRPHPSFPSPGPDDREQDQAPASPQPGLADRLRHAPHTIRLGPDASRIHLVGTSLATEDGWPEVTLDGQPVALAEADWDRIVVPIPSDVESGVLEVALPGGAVNRYHVVREATNGTPVGDEESAPGAGDGPWEAEVD
ncbi:MAG: hypothetical protein QOH66_1059 [Actinomycetota bacterium]|nr:hypothetical protein [Actinomycetota bacterium]